MPYGQVPKNRRAVAPSTRALYDRTLRRAFGDAADLSTETHLPDLTDWPRASRITLKAALWNAGRYDLAEGVEIPYAIRKVKEIPSEEETLAYERVAQELKPGVRALALLPIYLGFRAQEVLGLDREDVKRAVKTGQLKFLRKGGKEMILPADGVRSLLEELLQARPCAPRWRKDPALREERKKVWTRAGEILCAGTVRSQGTALYRLIVRAGKNAGIKLHPHLLRHIFASRAAGAGMPITTLQFALGHANLQTTGRYVHQSYADLARWPLGPTPSK